MSGYTPLFDTVLDGTLFGKWPHTGIWTCLLSQADKHGVIDKHPNLLAAKIGVPLEVLISCIGDFMAPDPGSRTKEHEGRRLELVEPEGRDWGWRVLNHSHYREKARLAGKNARDVESGRNADRMRQERASGGRKDDRPPPTAADRRSPPPTPSHTQTLKRLLKKPQNKESIGPASRPDTPDIELVKQLYPKRAGSHRWPEAAKALNARRSEGQTLQAILDGVRRYAAFVRSTGKERTEYVMQAATFLGPSNHFAEPWDPPLNRGEIQQQSNIDASREWLRQQEQHDAAQ